MSSKSNLKLAKELASAPPSRHGALSSKRDLRSELIVYALEILSNEGLNGLTLRKVAARAGVSHAAPAHHFSGLPDLLGSVCGVGFERLADSMEAHRGGASHDPKDQLIAVCEGYVDFAQENAGLIALMFNTNRDQVLKSAFGDSGQRAYGILKSATQPFEPVGPDGDSTETLIWSLVHGFAFLKLGGRFDNPGRSTTNPSVASILPELKLKSV